MSTDASIDTCRFDRYFTDSEERGDLWGHRWRGSQKLRFCQCISFIRESVNCDDVSILLDLGCASGDFTSLVADECAPARVIASDTSHLAVESLRASFPNFESIQCTLPQLPPAAAQADLIIAMEVMYYLDLPSLQSALDRIATALQCNSTFVCSFKANTGAGYLSSDQIRTEIENRFCIDAEMRLHQRWYAELIERRLLAIYRAARTRRLAERSGKRLRWHLLQSTLVKAQESVAHWLLGLVAPSRTFNAIGKRILQKHSLSHVVLAARKRMITSDPTH
jgi:trans-aconitate methyltransferase